MSFVPLARREICCEVSHESLLDVGTNEAPRGVRRTSPGFEQEFRSTVVGLIESDHCCTENVAMLASNVSFSNGRDSAVASTAGRSAGRCARMDALVSTAVTI